MTRYHELFDREPLKLWLYLAIKIGAMVGLIVAFRH